MDLGLHGDDGSGLPVDPIKPPENIYCGTDFNMSFDVPFAKFNYTVVNVGGRFRIAVKKHSNSTSMN